MKVTEDWYHIQSDSIKSKKKFLSFADIHYSFLQQLFYKGTMEKFFQHLIEKNKEVDAILIPGDLLFYFVKFQDTKFLKALIDDFKYLSDCFQTPVCISYGNHDLPLFEKKLTEMKKQELDLGYHLDNRKNGIYVLDNEQVKFDDVVITGFSPRREVYNSAFMPFPSLETAKEEFQSCNFHFSKGNVHILMSHDNRFFAHPNITKDYKDLYENLTLILGGHMHDGYVPMWFQEMWGDLLKDYGVFEKLPPLINMCRGAFIVSEGGTSNVILPKEGEEVFLSLREEEAASIINRGVAKYSWFLKSKPSYTKIFLSPFHSKGFERNPIKCKRR